MDQIIFIITQKKKVFKTPHLVNYVWNPLRNFVTEKVKDHPRNFTIGHVAAKREDVNQNLANTISIGFLPYQNLFLFT